MALALAAAALPPPARPCAASAFPSDIRVLTVVRVGLGPDGHSRFLSDDPLTAETKDYLSTGRPFRQVDFGPAAVVRLVSGPADIVFPVHASIGREMFLTLQGGSFITLPDGSERAVEPGTLVVMDDVGPKSGHGGRTGPCGYVALQLVPALPAPASVHPGKE